MSSVPHAESSAQSPQDAKPDYVSKCLYYLDLCNLEIEELEARIKYLKKDANDRAKEFLQQAPTDDERKELASEIYWLREYVKSSTVCEAMGIYPQQIQKHLYAGIIEVRCCDCGNPVEVTITSRTAMQYARSPKHNYNRCPSCEQKRAEQSAAWHIEYHQKEQQRQARIAELKAMPYAEYLKTDHWQETRRRALKKAYYTCQLCNATKTVLHVHHRTYERRGEEYLSDLIVLCADCHETFHENGVIK